MVIRKEFKGSPPPKGAPPAPRPAREMPEYWVKHFNHDGPAGEAPSPAPSGGPSDAPKNPPSGGTAGTKPVPHDLRTVGVEWRPPRHRARWLEYIVLFVGAVVGSAIGGALATALVIWLMVT